MVKIVSVSEKMRAQIRGLKQASRNAANGISFIQTTEGYLQETQDILHRMRELAVQSANGIYTDEDRMQIMVEVSQLVDEVDRIASHAQFNGMNMLTGRFARETRREYHNRIHVASHRGKHGPEERVYIGTMTSTGIGIKDIGSGEMISITTPELANRTIGTIDMALKKVSKQRADLGAYQNRLEHAIIGINVGAENLQAAESRIRDVDMADEMVKFTKNQILVQTGTAMLGSG